MSKREPAILLDDIGTAIAKIERYTAGLERTAFLRDEKTADAVVRNLEIIGEAVRDYMAVDLELVWNILQDSLPALRAQLAGIQP